MGPRCPLRAVRGTPRATAWPATRLLTAAPCPCWRDYPAARPASLAGRVVFGAELHAENIALWIMQRRVAVEPRGHGGAQGRQPFDLRVHGPRRPQVEVHPVLRRAWRLRDPDEPHVRAAPARRLDVGAVARRFLVHVGAEDRGPEPGQR